MAWKLMLPLVKGMDVRSEPAAGGPSGSVRVYVFRGWRGEVCSAAPGPQVLQAFGDIATLSTLFGGYMTFGRLFSSNEFLGVYGDRNASRFRRLLRERFADIEIVHAAPPQRHSGTSLTGSRLSSAARQALETRIRQPWPST